MAFTEQAASAPATQFWRDRKPADWASVLPKYWEAGGQPHRQAMLSALRSLPRFETLREIGCCAGTNLRLIREAMPWISVEGTEIGIPAATFAQDKFVKDPYTRVVCTDMFLDAPLWDDQEVDVTMSIYTLAYVAPEELEGMLRHMLRASRVGVLLIEPMLGEPGRLPVHYTMEWRHNYSETLQHILPTISRRCRLDVTALPQAQEFCDGAAMVTFLE